MGVEARKIRLEEGRGSVADLSYVGKLVQKWSPLLEGLPDRTETDRYILGCMAMLFENQAVHLKNMTEDTRTINVGSFTKFIFPVLRRVFPNLIANEIVSVQPMTAPIGAVFFLDYIYGTTKGGTVAGSVFPRDFDRDYSSESVKGEILATGDGAAFGGGGTALAATLGFTPVRPLDASRGYSLVVREISAVDGSTVQEATDNGAGGFTGDVIAGTVNYSNGAISAFKFTAAAANGNQIKAYYTFDGELSSRVPQINLDVKKAAVEAQSRRLKALWSSEAAEDLRAFHGLDAETEIVSAVAQEIALEIDREVIDDLFLASTGTTSSFDRVPPAGINELDHLRSLITTLATVSNLIHKKTLRAPANWIVTSPEISALLTSLQSHGDFRPLWVTPGGPSAGAGDLTGVDVPRPIVQHGQFGIYKTGTMSNKWLIYEDPFFARDQMLLGLKGGSYLDAGYVWAPYIPLQVTPTFLDPNDFSFRKGLRTRYAKKILRPDFYGQVRIINL